MPTTSIATQDAGACFHGGAFFEAIGESFDNLRRRDEIINADVLDAWFPPAPSVLDTLRGDLDWLVRTSPPTHCTGLLQTVAEARGVPAACLLPGAGSSDLIFRAFGRWLTPASRVLLLDPTYGEYVHVCAHVIGCLVERLPLYVETGYRLDLGALRTQLQFGEFDLVVLVNPNNPTGQYEPANALAEVLRDAPARTMVWIDEAYLDYVGAAESLECFATGRPNVVVCKSLSKVYALSGMRAAYLCGAEEVIAPLHRWTPPWVIGLPAQLAAVRAMQEPEYYHSRYRQTHDLRRQLAAGLRALHSEWDITEGCANFVLCHLPTHGPTASAVVAQCRTRGLFLRDVGLMGASVGSHSLRIAVKDADTQCRVLKLMSEIRLA